MELSQRRTTRVRHDAAQVGRCRRSRVGSTHALPHDAGSADGPLSIGDSPVVRRADGRPVLSGERGPRTVRRVHYAGCVPPGTVASASWMDCA